MVRRAVRGVLAALALTALIAPSPSRSAASTSQRVNSGERDALMRSVSWPEVAPIVVRLADALPPELGSVASEERAARWPSWVQARRQAIEARLAQGEVDSLVNLLLFGTSFTRAPRITSALLAELDTRWRGGDSAAQELLTHAYRRRAADLVAALANPGNSERLHAGRRIVEQQGHDLSTEAGRGAAANDLLKRVLRVRQEAAALAQELEALGALPDATAAVAARSRIFRDRGLAPDSTVLTQFAIDRALCTLAEREVLPPRSVRRVAIVGPGLDFADKQEGFDFYDVQSLQPFTTLDSLRHCNLAAPGTTGLMTIDVSNRVNEHLRRAHGGAQAGASYRIVLPMDETAGWTAEAVAFWKRAGQHIGKPVDHAVPTVLPGVRARGIDVDVEAVAKLRVIDGNIVLDRLQRADEDGFDLVIATNVLVYYDTFEQTLAAANLASMLRPGGVLLTNTAILEIPEVPLRSAGYVTVRFSEYNPDGEHMVWYARVEGR